MQLRGALRVIRAGLCQKEKEKKETVHPKLKIVRHHRLLSSNDLSLRDSLNNVFFPISVFALLGRRLALILSAELYEAIHGCK